MENKKRKQPPAEAIPLTPAQLAIRRLRATDSDLKNPPPLPQSERPGKVGILRRTFGNHPELNTPQPTAGRAEVQPAPHQPEGVRLQHIESGLGYLASGEVRTPFESRRAEILQQAAEDARQQIHGPNIPPQGSR